MSRPIFSVRYLASEAQLPQKLERGRAYFIADEQVIILDMGDGRGPVRYGDKPGPQGMAGEPIPQLQGQIDDLAAASLQTTLNLFDISKDSKQKFEHLKNFIQENLDTLKSQNEETASAILRLLLIVHDKFTAYDDAFNILARTLANLYPATHGGHAGDGVTPINTGEIITADGVNYVVNEAHIDGNSGTVVLTLYNPPTTGLQEGDTVNFDGGSFTVNSITQEDGTGIIAITLFTD